ncbi:ATP-dependent Clp protease ATP-binding subunit [Candidatus Nomurabacteria bacterium]|nr:ATP-dependent Clp protease ATP-binding subunit [Candidatus Nomurabacteria bacterium]
MILVINKNHPRVIKAKYKRLFDSSTLRTTLGLIAAVALIASIALVVLGFSVGWLVSIVPVVLLMLHEWYRHDLLVLPPTTQEAPEDIIDSSLLAVLPSQVDTIDTLVSALKKTQEYWFLTNRYLLYPDIIQTIKPAENWLQTAIDVYRNSGSTHGVNAAHMLAAIILCSPDKSLILSHTQNTEEDIIDGLHWQAYVQSLIASIKQRKNQGGIARDWAAGYTPLLDSYAVNISRSIQYGGISHREIIGHTNVVSQMKAIFTSNGRANIALVGAVGVGKSTIIQAFAESLLFDNKKAKIAYNQVYQIDIASLLTRVSPDRLEYTIRRLCAEAYHAKNIVLYFDNAGAFFGAGGSVADATNIILPIIEAGRVRMIFSFSQLDWQYIQKAKSQIAALLNYQVVTPTNEQDTLRILENQALFTESQYNCTFTYRALKEVYLLANRYGPEIAMPGRAISVMEDVARSCQDSLIQKTDVQKTVEQTTGIKIATADADDKNALLNLEEDLKKRVVGQDVAIKELVSALKRSRTGIANPNRPIGTFLFLGPTGVGKTELSKSLADVYFGGSSGFVRVDMNEYITQDSIHKLLSSESGFGSAFLETVRRQPFSVVLFDEIEKAHPDIVNALLQLLDEGEIKDADNRTVSFKDAIVIATSNAGAEQIRDQLKNQLPIAQLQDTLVDTLIDKGTFAPEFINRFDGVIIFSPLSQDQLKHIITIQLRNINNTLAAQGITVALDDSAVAWLIAQGYDERLGARPLRRMMQKTVETAVSNILLERQVQHGSTITLSAQQLQSV